MAHRLAWQYATGDVPAADIDHINGVKNDNRLANLRPATRAQNMQNQRRARSDNATGILGVGCVRGRWKSQIQSDGIRMHLGTFDTAEHARSAYLDAKAARHPFQTIVEKT